MTELTEIQYDALVSMVNIARSKQVRHVDELRERTVSAGFSVEDVNAAIKYWGHDIAKHYTADQLREQVLEERRLGY